jgi:hypothetical protein
MVSCKGLKKISCIHVNLIRDTFECAVDNNEEANLKTGPGTNYKEIDHSPTIRSKTFKVIKRKDSGAKVEDGFGGATGSIANFSGYNKSLRSLVSSSVIYICLLQQTLNIKVSKQHRHCQHNCRADTTPPQLQMMKDLSFRQVSHCQDNR